MPLGQIPKGWVTANIDVYIYNGYTAESPSSVVSPGLLSRYSFPFPSASVVLGNPQRSWPIYAILFCFPALL